MSGIPHVLVRNAVRECLNTGGCSIPEIEEAHCRRYPGDGSQERYRDNPAWHVRRDIIRRVAKRLWLDPGVWDSSRTSNEFADRVTGELENLKRAGLLKWWNDSRKYGIFRPVGTLDTEPLDISMAPRDAPEAGYLGMDTTEGNLRRVFVEIMTRGKKNNTYKFALARSILDYCAENDESSGNLLEVPYSYFASKFLEYYWHQEYRFHFRQNFDPKHPPSAIKEIREVFGGEMNRGDFSSQDADSVREAEGRILESVFGHAARGTSQVVPRFQNIPHGSRTRKLEVFYRHSDAEQKIVLRPEAYVFFRKNRAVLSKVVTAEWARFLEKINNSLPRLVSKVDNQNPRRGSLMGYREAYLKHMCRCFYCKHELERGRTEVDHFIPWSYIFEDDWWNLVLACKSCNSKKRDALPPLDFVEALLQRNSEYERKICPLATSLKQLDAGRGWETEITNHYRQCMDYGFFQITLP